MLRICAAELGRSMFWDVFGQVQEKQVLDGDWAMQSDEAKDQPGSHFLEVLPAVSWRPTPPRLAYCALGLLPPL